MKVFYSFLVVGLIRAVASLIYDLTKLTPGHITSMFVVLGAFLDIFNIYDIIVEYVGGGAMVPITSFGHQLIHGGLQHAHSAGVLGLIMGMFDLTASGISAAIIFSFFLTLIFKPKN